MIISNIFKIFKYLSRSIYITIELICFTVVIIMTSSIRWITLIGKWGKELVNSIVNGIYYLIAVNTIIAVLYISAIIVYLILNTIGTIPLAQSIASLLVTIILAGIYVLEHLSEKSGLRLNFVTERNASKFAMFLEKENARSFFRFSFRATFIFPLSMST